MCVILCLQTTNIGVFVLVLPDQVYLYPDLKVMIGTRSIEYSHSVPIGYLVAIIKMGKRGSRYNLTQHL